MTFISYAQNFEDVILYRALKDVDIGTYVDVGAHDPTQHSVTRAFYDRGWRGVNVEPVPYWYERLSEERPEDTNLRAAVDDNYGARAFYEVVGTGLSTLRDDVADRHSQDGFEVRRCEVPVRTLASILDEYSITVVHFLKIDVEGAEAGVLRSLDFGTVRPWILVVEATEPLSTTSTHDEWHCALSQKDYEYVYFDGLNRFYLAFEQVARKPAFQAPPNVFDEFISHTEWEARQHAEEMREALSQAKERWEACHREINAVYSSSSWRVTRPLRMLKAGILRSRSVLKRIAVAAVRTIKNRQGINLYRDLRFGSFLLHVQSRPLNDHRGIGRTSNALFDTLKRKAESASSDASRERKEVYYYPTVHFCPRRLPARSVVMIHDVIPMLLPEEFPEANREWRRTYKRIAQQADLITTVSQSSAESIAEYLEIDQKRIKVVGNGVTRLPVGDAAEVRTPDCPYLVSLGANDLHKNLSVVLDAMQRVRNPVALCVIGYGSQRLVSEIQRRSLQDRVWVLGRLSDEEVSFVLSRSIGLVFPSLYEGFGLPPFEAAFLCVPSICSDRPAMNELWTDEEVLFADPLDPDAWTDKIQWLLEYPEKRRGLGERAYSRAQSMGWENVADTLIKYIESEVK